MPPPLLPIPEPVTLLPMPSPLCGTPFACDPLPSL
jgi:hypothetical protein